MTHGAVSNIINDDDDDDADDANHSVAFVHYFQCIARCISRYSTVIVTSILLAPRSTCGLAAAVAAAATGT